MRQVNTASAGAKLLQSMNFDTTSADIMTSREDFPSGLNPNQHIKTITLFTLVFCCIMQQQLQIIIMTKDKRLMTLIENGKDHH